VSKHVGIIKDYTGVFFILVINQLDAQNLCTGRPPTGVMIPEAV